MEKYGFTEELDYPDYIPYSNIRNLFMSKNKSFMCIIFETGDFSLYYIDKKSVYLNLFKGKLTIYNIKQYLDIYIT